MDLIPSNSADLTHQVSPTTIHANSSLLLSHSRCLIRDALQAQSDSHTLTLIAGVDSFHRPRYLCFNHTDTLSVVFKKKTLGCTLTRKSTCGSTYSDPRFNVRMLFRYPRELLPPMPRPTEKCALSATPPLNCPSRRNLQFSSSTHLLFPYPATPSPDYRADDPPPDNRSWLKVLIGLRPHW